MRPFVESVERAKGPSHNIGASLSSAPLSTIVFFLSTAIDVYFTSHHLFSITPSTFLYAPPIFLYLPYSTPIRVRSLLRSYIHPFGLYESSLQPAHPPGMGRLHGGQHGEGVATSRHERGVSTARERRHRGPYAAWEARHTGVRGAWEGRHRCVGGCIRGVTAA